MIFINWSQGVLSTIYCWHLNSDSVALGKAAKVEGMYMNVGRLMWIDGVPDL